MCGLCGPITPDGDVGTVYTAIPPQTVLTSGSKASSAAPHPRPSPPRYKPGAKMVLPELGVSRAWLGSHILGLPSEGVKGRSLCPLGPSKAFKVGI